MRYRLKKGVVLFSMCGEKYILPSREAKGLIQFIISASQELAEILDSEEEVAESSISAETRNKLNRLKKAGFIEEY